MGQQKLLLPWGNKPIIRHIADELAASAVKQTIVITGSDHVPVSACLAGAPVQIAQNLTPRQGMLSSVRTGLRLVDKKADGFMVVLGDQPGLNTTLVNALAAFWAADRTSLARPIFQQRRGHPLIVPMEFREAVLNNFDGVGLKGLLRQAPERIREWPAEDVGAVTDIDTPEDYQRERQRLQVSTLKK